jgi:hypothetical protein
MGQHRSSEGLIFGPSESAVSQAFAGIPTGDPMTLDRHGISDLESRHESTGPSMVARSEIVSCAGLLTSGGTVNLDQACDRLGSQVLEPPTARGNEVKLRAPLRQTWIHHPRLVPLGNDVEMERPGRDVLPHRDHFTSEPFRNPYAGFRDQPLYYRDSSRPLVNNSTLSDVGPPPPHHTAKTFGTLTAISVIGIGVYALAPESFTGVSKEGALKEAKQDFINAWTKPPVMDKDNGMYNYAGHPYVGMNFYLSQRNYGESPLYSFLFSALTSTCFEYFVESWAERPSVQDLLITPIVGSILGELVYRTTQEMRKDGFTKTEKVILTIINPLYVMQNGYR